MRTKFQETLGTYNELAKERRHKNELKTSELAELESAVAFTLKKTAERRASSPEAQRMILEIQDKKQKIMSKLKRDLTNEPDRKPRKLDPKVRSVGMRDNELRLGKKSDAPINEGVLLTDGDWGIQYDLDPKTVPLHLRKKYLVEEAKRKLHELLNEQILLDEMSSEYTHVFKRLAYERIATEENTGEKAGVIAEKMVRGFLQKLSINHGLDFEIRPADLHQDMDQKIDFIIKRKNRHRGVRVEEQEPTEKLGIQFTISQTQETLTNKRRQIDRSIQHLKEDDVEDIILVSIPLNDATHLHHTWQKKGSPPGGPDALWSPQLKERIFREVLKGFLNPFEIEAQWRAIEGAEQKKAA